MHSASILNVTSLMNRNEQRKNSIKTIKAETAGMGEKFSLFNTGRILYKGHEYYLRNGPLGRCGYHEIISPLER